MKMMKSFAAIAALLVSTVALADGPIAYPGSTWGQLTFPSSVISNTPEDGNWLYQGKVTQGADWFKFGSSKNWVFDTYGSLGFSLDKNGLDYNNKVVPALGANVRRVFNSGSIDIGVEGVYERHFGNRNGDGSLRSPGEHNLSGYGVQGYISYWFGWNLK